MDMNRSLPTGNLAMSEKLGDLSPHAPNRLIVKFKDGLSKAELRTTRLVKNSLSAVSIKTLGLTGAEIWELPDTISVEKALLQYRNSPIFEYIEPDYVVTAGAVTPTATFPNDPGFNQLWGLHNTGQSGGTVDADIDAPEAWDIQTGDPNLVIGVIDTGVDYNHQDLVGNIWTNTGEIAGDGIDNDGNGYIDDIRGWDFAYNDNDPMDVYGHGTHVSGTIAGKGNNGVGVTGVAWNAKIMPLKFLDDDGYGYTSGAISAIDYATAQGVKITNNSWGGGDFSQALYDAINTAGQQGALFIAAAGNDYGNNNDVSPSYPASYDLANIISVASTTRTDALSSFSNIGLTSVDLGAPGSDIYSSTPGNNYDTYSGTSMATPHVAGAAALLWSENPDWTAQQVKNALMNTGDSLASLAGKTVSGKRLNVYNALASAYLPSVTVSVSPASVQEDGATNLVYTFTRTNLNLSSPLTVNFAVSGTANAALVGADPADYTVSTSGAVTFNPTTKLGAVTFAANTTTATVTVDPKTDTLEEIQNETVAVAINSGTGYVGGSPSAVMGTIVSEEMLPIFSNPSPITIFEYGASDPYPSAINVSGLSGIINSLQVTLADLNHTYADDIDILLVGPTGAKSLLMSDVGGWDGINNATLTFDATAGAFLPDEGPIFSGSYQPTNSDDDDFFDYPAPGDPYGADFSVFNNTDPNGTWSLYVMDDYDWDSGSIDGGWSLTIGATPVPSVTVNVNPVSVQEDGATHLVYTFTRTSLNLSSPLTVNFAVSGTANAALVGTDPADYAVLTSSAVTFDPTTKLGAVTFAANATTATVTVDPITDTLAEIKDETVEIAINSGSGYIGGSSSAATGTIVSEEDFLTFFSDSFANNNNGWTLGTEWQIGSATTSTGHVYGYPDPGVDHTPTDDNGVAGVVIGGNASTTPLHDFYYLTSPIFDTSTANHYLAFEYSRWLNSDYTPYMQNTVDVFDGSSWINLWSSGEEPGVTDNAWMAQTFDISSYKGKSTSVRFGFNIGSLGEFPVSSWNVDDVKIYGDYLSLPVVTVAATDSSAGETALGTTPNPGQYTLTRTGFLTDSLTVNVAVSGAALNGFDYSAIRTTVTFAAGSATALVNLNVIDDDLQEGPETAILTVVEGSDYTVGATASATVNITDGLTFTGTAGNDRLNGTAGDDTLIGLAGNDALDGKTGADALIGGLGNDTYTVDSIGDVVTENANEGADTVKSSISYTLGANFENLTLSGTANLNGTGNTVNNKLTGNSGNNILTGLAGNDTLDGKAGADTMIGGLGNDTYTVDNIGDVITENANEGTDTVKASIDYTLGANLENLTLTGNANINGTGNALKNKITGNTGANILNGDAGADTLTGKGGNDTFVFQFGQSTITALDRITDFAIGADKIDLLTQGGSAMNAPVAFTRAADSATTNINTVVTNVFADANGAAAGNQVLGLNSAALVRANTSTYLIVNDGTAGFQSANDLVINLTGITGTLPVLGSIPVSNFFI
ncbi:MAG: S8 family serine peptidase [Cyanobacteriota bacterium]|jgi:subtilisin family serine protease/Ca2+-binding RTX toxin-like protein